MRSRFNALRAANKHLARDLDRSIARQTMVFILVAVVVCGATMRLHRFLRHDALRELRQCSGVGSVVELR